MGTQNPRFFPLMGTVPSTKYCWAPGSCPSVKILSKSVGHGSLGAWCPNRENHPTPFTYVLYPIKGARKGARAAISLRALIEEVERLYKGYLRPPVYTTRPPVGPGQAQFVMADKRRGVRRLVRPQSNFLQLIKTSSSSKGAVYKLLWLHLSLISPT